MRDVESKLFVKVLCRCKDGIGEGKTFYRSACLVSKFRCLCWCSKIKSDLKKTTRWDSPILTLVVALFIQNDRRQGVEGISNGLPDDNNAMKTSKPLVQRGGILLMAFCFSRFVNLFSLYVSLGQAETVFLVSYKDVDHFLFRQSNVF